jgi:transforming growth factor-beta-induced protein
MSGTATTDTPGTSTGGTGATADTVAGLLSSDPRFTTLSAALRATNLEQTLGQAGPFTVFAPTDQAFSSLPAGTLQGLLADPSKLTSILSYHVAQGKLTPSDLSSAQTIPTVEGNAIGVSRQGAEVLLNGTTRVTATQLETGNGVVYVIDKVLLPPNITLPAGG